MKITDVKPFSVWQGGKNLFVVKVETDEGIYGVGEGGVISRELAMKGIVEHFRQWLIGQDPMRIGALWQEMYRSSYFEGGRIITGAISAIDIALYDIMGKKLGVPVYQLLGGAHRHHVQCFVTGLGPMGPEALEKTKKLVSDGWSVVRLGAGGFGSEVFEPRESIAITAEWLPKIREAVGPGPVLGLEYHHRLSVAEAASLCQKLPPGTIDFLEEPIRDECPEAYEALRRMTDTPFAIGEEFSSKWAFVPYIERGITNFARVDICNVGGFTEAMKVAGWCEAHYIDVMPHNPLGPICTMACIHFSAAVPNFAWLEDWSTNPVFEMDNTWAFQGLPKLEGDRYPLPTTPGLGIEFNEDAAGEFRFYEQPHLHRKDGSKTNW